MGVDDEVKDDERDARLAKADERQAGEDDDEPMPVRMIIKYHVKCSSDDERPMRMVIGE